MEKKHFYFFALLLCIATVVVLKENALQMPHIILRTFIRMLGAYALSLVFSLTIGIIIAHNSRAFKIVFPVLDILQSVPILGFLPFAIIFIVQTVPVLGSEISTMFLIFTSMTWAIIFNVIEGVRSIPTDIRDAARLNKISGIRYLIHIVFPALYAPIISGSITGWGGAWYFLVAGEYVSFGKQPPYVLPGVGSFIVESAYAGDILHSIIGMGILAGMVLFMNLFVWRPLLAKASRFSYKQTTSEQENSNPSNALVEYLERTYQRIKTRILNMHNEHSTRVLERLCVSPATYFKEKNEITVYDAALWAGIVGSFGALYIVSGKEISYIGTILISTVLTMLRIGVAYVIAAVWTVAFAIYFGRNKKMLNFLMPVFDVLQSIPAIAVFPVIVVFVISIIGGERGIQVSSILLLLTGMQWYLLFNVVRAVSLIPGEIMEMSSLIRLDKLQKIFHIILPAIFPTFIIGSIQAIGGGWNATIVSEYIQYNDQVFSTQGLGFLIADSSKNGDIAGIILSVLVMMVIIVILNNVVWRNALKRADLYKF